MFCLKHHDLNGRNQSKKRKRETDSRDFPSSLGKFVLRDNSMGDLVPNLWDYKFKEEPFYESMAESFVKKESEDDFFISNLRNSVTPITAPMKKVKSNRPPPLNLGFVDQNLSFDSFSSDTSPDAEQEVPNHSFRYLLSEHLWRQRTNCNRSSGGSSSDENSIYGDDFGVRAGMSVITPRSSAKFNHSISLIFSGFLETHDHPRDPIRWSLIHVSILSCSQSLLYLLLSGFSVDRMGPARVFHSRSCQLRRLRWIAAHTDVTERVSITLAAICR